jgi:hypothetical protein
MGIARGPGTAREALVTRGFVSLAAARVNCRTERAVFAKEVAIIPNCAEPLAIGAPRRAEPTWNRFYNLSKFHALTIFPR